MNAMRRLRETLTTASGLAPLRVLSASGQLGYGVPEPAFSEGLKRQPHFIGADMGSIDPGPYYLGSGNLATSDGMTRNDLAHVLRGARRLGVPFLLGTAGTAGAAPHLAKTLQMVRDIAGAEGLHFRLASIAADMPRDMIKRAIRGNQVRRLGAIPPLTERNVDEAAHIVGQMGIEAFQRALDAGADVVIAGRACDTAVYAAIPAMLGYPLGPAMHLAKIVECASLCTTPGGRDALLGTLEGEGFIIDSMNPVRNATPMSVAAHSLYEQGDPYRVYEPEGTLHLDTARYEALDAHRCRISTGGNLAFPFTPPEVMAGTAYRFNVYHVMEVNDLASLFPVTIEDL